MRVVVEMDTETLLSEAALFAAEGIRWALAERGEARVVLGVDTSLIEVSEKLAMVSGIDWSRVVLFLFNEYVGLPTAYVASFRYRLRRR